jgi:hypothetical protein
VMASASRRTIGWKIGTPTSSNSSNKRNNHHHHYNHNKSHSVKRKRLTSQAVKRSSSAGSSLYNRSGTCGSIERYLIKLPVVLNCD